MSTNTDKSAETDFESGLNLSDPRHQIIYALRKRLAHLRAEPKTESTPTVSPENTTPVAETAESQPLAAGRPPESGRNLAETPPEYSAHSAGTAAAAASKKRPQNESPLDDLPEPIQAAILNLLDTHTLDRATLEITATAPYGLGINTSRSSLYRFHQRHTKIKQTKLREESAAETARLLADVKTTGDISHTATHLIAIRLLETAIIENSNPSHLLALSKAIDRLRATEHSERRLRLAESKLAAAK